MSTPQSDGLTPTPELRWFVYGYYSDGGLRGVAVAMADRRLQQKWRSEASGHEEWRDVPDATV